MTDLSTLTDTELNEKIQLAMGKEVESITFPCHDWLTGDSGFRCGNCETWVEDERMRGFRDRDPCVYRQHIPNYHRDLNALKSGPEKMLREAGWMVINIFELKGGRWCAQLTKESRIVQAFGPTEERARAEAVCQGLEVSK